MYAQTNQLILSISLKSMYVEQSRVRMQFTFSRCQFFEMVSHQPLLVELIHSLMHLTKRTEYIEKHAILQQNKTKKHIQKTTKKNKYNKKYNIYDTIK